MQLESVIEKISEFETDTEVRICRRAENDTCIAHQGDVYLWKVADNHPHSDKVWGNGRQVAVGTTKGSRHVITGDVEVFEGTKLPAPVIKYLTDNNVPKETWSQYLGPTIVAKGETTLVHPEHAHHKVKFPATMQVTYQVDTLTRKRVSD